MDALMEYLKFTSSAVFAVPPGVAGRRASTSGRRCQLTGHCKSRRVVI